MPLFDIGPVGFHQAQGVANLSFIPQYDRAAIVTRLLIDKVSAADTWIITCAGRELARLDIESTGNQQVLANAYSAYPKNNDIFAFWDTIGTSPLIYPVPQGTTFAITNVGGATANIEIIYQEVAPSEVTSGMMNHPNGRTFVLPLYLYRNANVTTAGESNLDSQIGPNWFPNLAVANMLPPTWSVICRGIFLEGGGVNTFSGAANHQSNTTYLAAFKNGQRLFTRDTAAGIPLVGSASAAGSANVVIGTDTTPYPPFQEVNLYDWNYFSPPLQFGPGAEYQFALNIAGDVTGGAGYGTIRQMLLVEVHQQAGF